MTEVNRRTSRGILVLFPNNNAHLTSYHTSCKLPFQLVSSLCLFEELKIPLRKFGYLVAWKCVSTNTYQIRFDSLQFYFNFQPRKRSSHICLWEKIEKLDSSDQKTILVINNATNPEALPSEKSWSMAYFMIKYDW